MDELRRGFAFDRTGTVIVIGHADAPTPTTDDVERLSSRPVVVLGVAERPLSPEWLDLTDAVLEDERPLVDSMVETIGRNEAAAISLVLLLRGSLLRTRGEGLVAESATYSMLQAGPEFARWREAHPRGSAPPQDVTPRVAVVRKQETLCITLTRPHRRNALDTRMRDELSEALTVAEAEPSLRVELRGEGPNFSAGGDLDEFGQRPDPSTAHLVRLERSPARQLLELEPRTTAYVHGACAGSGVELPAFCATVVAHSGATFALPEVSLGLIPGAGGTVSLTRRIGRQRTAWLGLSGQAIDAPTAKAWGLVDTIDDAAFDRMP